MSGRCHPNPDPSADPRADSQAMHRAVLRQDPGANLRGGGTASSPQRNRMRDSTYTSADPEAHG